MWAPGPAMIRSQTAPLPPHPTPLSAGLIDAHQAAACRELARSARTPKPRNRNAENEQQQCTETFLVPMAPPCCQDPVSNLSH
ncbi:hypothetical protein SKAU_G00080600 [Synaphobranchus kaupii]|uniref:Uncharacterized protein n=1 Tax=Synaphobranchus kaupii TaxID=118154 RepID=A0A9Q1FV20_SYNKA|nr:hypothetical protein SKAU_G00080600 [Synaphobranchus kaupii]